MILTHCLAFSVLKVKVAETNYLRGLIWSHPWGEYPWPISWLKIVILCWSVQANKASSVCKSQSCITSSLKSTDSFQYVLSEMCLTYFHFFYTIVVTTMPVHCIIIKLSYKTSRSPLMKSTRRCCLLRRVNRRTDRRILKIFLPGCRIQSEILTNFRILQLQGIADSCIFWARILDLACN